MYMYLIVHVGEWNRVIVYRRAGVKMWLGEYHIAWLTYNDGEFLCLMGSKGTEGSGNWLGYPHRHSETLLGVENKTVSHLSMSLQKKERHQETSNEDSKDRGWRNSPQHW